MSDGLTPEIRQEEEALDSYDFYTALEFVGEMAKKQYQTLGKRSWTFFVAAQK